MQFVSVKWQEFSSKNPVNALLDQFKAELIAVGVFSFVANVLMLTPTIYMLQVFDRFLRSQNGATLIAVSAIALFLFLVMAFSEWMRTRILVRAGVRLDELLNTRVFRASFVATLRNKNRNLSEAFADLTNLRQFMTGSGIHALFDVPWIPIYAAVAYMLHPLIGLLIVIFVLISGGILWWGQRYHADIDQSVHAANLKASLFLQTKLRNAEVIGAMGMTRVLQDRWRKIQDRALDINAVAHERSERIQGLIKFTQYAQQSLTLAAGALLVIEGQMSVGAMIAATTLVARASQPMQLLVTSWRGSMAARISYKRLVSLLENHEEYQGTFPEKSVKGHIKINDLSISVEGRETPILREVNLEFKPGELVAIVGPSGSGKSTLARCILGLWPAHDGQVLFDGELVNDWNRSDLGSQVGYVPQDVELFDGSVADNISRFGARDAKKIIEAAKAAGVHDMILHFPQGYETQMGVSGSFLSGGQRQRIALARALYGDPSLLVLDEANANLDDVGEAALMSAVLSLRDRGKTILFITHRGSVLNVADRIAVMRDGRLSAFGTRQEVLDILRT